MCLAAHLLEEVLHNGVLGHLRTDDEATFDLLLDAREHLLVFFRREALSTCDTQERENDYIVES